MKLKFDYTNMLEDSVGEHGLSLSEIKNDKDRIFDAFNIVGKHGIDDGYVFSSLPFAQNADINNIIRHGHAIRKKADAFVVCGIGGSALGALSIMHAMRHLNHNYLSKNKRGAPRIYVEDNIDPEKIKALLDIVNIKTTYFNFISKSGETPETLSQFLIIYDILKRTLGTIEAKKRIIVTTTVGSGALYKRAKKEGLKIFSIPPKLSGRFSVFSNVGLLPLAVAGVDIKLLFSGAGEMDKACKHDDIFKNPALMSAYLHYKALKSGKNISVMMPYAESLKIMADFYAQAWGESLGKALDLNGNKINVGQTPIKALGATDQHSQIQLYVDGPFDKVITFIGVEKFREDISIPSGELDGFEYLEGGNLTALLNIERRAAAFALTKAGRINFSIILPYIKEDTIGELLTYFMYQTVYVAAFLNIDPFDQPGVEGGKRATHALIGREGYEDLLHQINAAEKKLLLIKGEQISVIDKSVAKNKCFGKKSVKDLQLKGKRVLLRCDFNVPVKNGEITDYARIQNSLPTIRYLVNQGAKVIICSHFSRPKNGPEEKYSLKIMADSIRGEFGRFKFCDDPISDDTLQKTNNLRNGEILFLENLRFYKEEEANDVEFCKRLAALCDIYVNDAFGVSHREHSSVFGITKFVKDSVAGLLLIKEAQFLGDKLGEELERPFLAIVGGSKVSDKIGVLESLIEKTDSVIIGGGMAFTFLKAMGVSVGRSLVEEDKLDVAMGVINAAKERGVKLLLPVDIRVAREFPSPIDAVVDYENVEVGSIGDDVMGLDIGEKTEKMFSDAIKGAKTILWNGPMGVFENPVFARGTLAVAEAVAEASDGGAISVVGGGDSAAAAVQCGVVNRISHISTGGGASLEFLEGKELPGIACLNDKE